MSVKHESETQKWNKASAMNVLYMVELNYMKLGIKSTYVGPTGDS